ncbi:MAG: FAD-dependent oxidoreductase [Fimbriimonadaceae bacterium]|nr:FAD-dependent oxidoreductase [Fimbriimonadaceae bacterium]
MARLTRRQMLTLTGAAALARPVRAAGPALDLLVYGATAGGVVAAIAARQLGLRVLLVAAGRRLGGLTSGGLGATDAGNRGSIGGLARDFYRRVEQHYQQSYGPDSAPAKACSQGFRFEPSVAEQLLGRWAAEHQVPLALGERLVAATVTDRQITAVRSATGRQFEAAYFLDTTYEGDLLALARVSYTVGREPNGQYGESLNGVHYGHRNHNFNAPVDPYVIEGQPGSGLLPGIWPQELEPNGVGDRKVQAYNFRMCLTKAADRLPFPQPAGYDPRRYTVLARYLRSGIFDVLRLTTPMPHGKTDTNNYGGFSTDYIGGSWGWPDGDKAARQRIFADHVTYQQGLLWFLCHDEQVPAAVRAEVSAWGLPRDEFVATGGWPHQLYVREARRMVSDLVMTEHHCRWQTVAEHSVGLASYGMDSHHCQRVVVAGLARNEGNVEYGVRGPYPIGYGALVPRESECRNLLVSTCLSATHIAYGSIRMEPVFMVLGQSAATAVALALPRGQAVQQIDRDALVARLLTAGQLLRWEPGDEAASVPPIDPRSLPGIVLDDDDATQLGRWTPSAVPANRRVGRGYLHDGNAQKGELQLVYAPALPAAGKYQVVLVSVPMDNRASNVPVSITVAGQTVWQGLVNQQDASRNGFDPLATLDLPAGNQVRVILSNAGTNGHVVADGLQLLPLR